MDNHHVNISSSNISCGVIELSRLESDTEKVLYSIASYLYHPSRGQPASFVMWSDIMDSNGSLLYKKIKELFIESIISYTNFVENPKTSNDIRVWVWEIPHEKFKEWYKNKRIAKIKEGR